MEMVVKFGCVPSSFVKMWALRAEESYNFLDRDYDHFT